MPQNNPFDQFDSHDAPRGRVIPLAPDPLALNRDRRADDAAARAAANETARLELDRRRLLLDQHKADAKSDDPNTSATRAAAIAGYTSATQLDGIIADLEAKFARGPGATNGLAGLRDYNPFSTANAQFDSAGSAARGIVGQALGFTGGQLNTPREAEAAVGPFLPQANDRDEVIRDKIARLKQLRDTARTRSIATLGGVPDANGRITPVDPYSLASGGASQQPTAATGATRSEPIPEANGIINAGVQRGLPLDQVNAQLAAKGFPVASEATYSAALEWQRRHPRAPYNNAGAMREVPTTAMNRVSASPLASAVVGVANGMTGGWADELWGRMDHLITGRPTSEGTADADQRKQLLAAANPTSSFVGNLAGNVGAMALGGAGAARLGLTAALGKTAPLAGDIAFGALSGAGENNDSRLAGAALGSTMSAAGRGLFGGAARVAGAALRGVTDPAATFLAARGVPLSGGSMLGGRWKALEDKASSAIGVGDLIAHRQSEALAGMNRGVANEALAHIGERLPDNIEVGSPLHSYAQQAWNRAYGDARAGMTFLEDPQYRTDVFNLQHQADNGRLTEEAAKRLAATTHDVVTRRVANGGMNGDTYKTVVSELRQRAAGTPDPELRGALRDLRGYVDQAATRHSAPDAVEAMRNADTGYAKWGIYRDASSMAGGEPGVASPAQLQSAVRRADTSAGHNRFNQGTALLQDWSNASTKALGTKVPNSGTADRLGVVALPALGGGIGAGAGYSSGDTGGGVTAGTATGVGAALAMAAFNTPAGRAALARAVMDRNPLVRQIGEKATSAAPRFGLFGRALGGTTAPLLLK